MDSKTLKVLIDSAYTVWPIDDYNLSALASKIPVIVEEAGFVLVSKTDHERMLRALREFEAAPEPERLTL